MRVDVVHTVLRDAMTTRRLPIRVRNDFGTTVSMNSQSNLFAISTRSISIIDSCRFRGEKASAKCTVQSPSLFLPLRQLRYATVDLHIVMVEECEGRAFRFSFEMPLIPYPCPRDRVPQPSRRRLRRHNESVRAVQNSQRIFYVPWPYRFCS